MASYREKRCHAIWANPPCSCASTHEACSAERGACSLRRRRRVLGEAPGTALLRNALRPAVLNASEGHLARIAVVVGPEGGLAQEEVDAILASNANASMVSLGSSILRTETAGIVAPALVLYEMGGMGAGERA